MYCAANGNMIYPGFQGNFKNEPFANNNNNNNINNNTAMQQEFNEIKQNKKKTTNNNNEDNVSPDLFPNPKNFMKNTYMKKINNLFNTKPLDSLKIFQETGDMYYFFFFFF